jgi:hypothetical protein
MANKEASVWTAAAGEVAVAWKKKLQRRAQSSTARCVLDRGVPFSTSRLDHSKQTWLSCFGCWMQRRFETGSPSREKKSRRGNRKKLKLYSYCYQSACSGTKSPTSYFGIENRWFSERVQLEDPYTLAGLPLFIRIWF